MPLVDIQLTCPFPNCFEIFGDAKGVQDYRVARARLAYICPRCARKKEAVDAARLAGRTRAQIKQEMSKRADKPTRPSARDVDFILDNYPGE